MFGSMKRATWLLFVTSCAQAPLGPATRAYYAAPPAVRFANVEKRAVLTIATAFAQKKRPTPQLDARLVLAAREVLSQGRFDDYQTDQRYPANSVEWYGASFDNYRISSWSPGAQTSLDQKARQAAEKMLGLPDPLFMGLSIRWSTVRQQTELAVIWDERPVALDPLAKVYSPGDAISVSGRVLRAGHFVIAVGNTWANVTPNPDGKFRVSVSLPTVAAPAMLTVNDHDSGRPVEKLLLYVGVSPPNAPTPTRLICDEKRIPHGISNKTAHYSTGEAETPCW